MSTNALLYAQDAYAWAQETVELIRAGKWHAIDPEALMEEIGDVAKQVERELKHRLDILLAHLLKLSLAAVHLPHDFERAGRGWGLTVKRERLQVAGLLRNTPRVRKYLAEALTEAYPLARLDAAQGLPLDEDIIPMHCPWSLTQVLDEAYWPEGTTEGR